MTTTAFDPARYKQTTQEQWQDAAEAWHRWGPFLESWLGPATELLLDLAGVEDGSRVLDVAAGAGGQTVAAARRGARVLATDFSSNILDLAAAEARAAGLATVATQVMDGEALDVEPGSFDAVVSRLGLMYFPDKVGSLEEARRALRPGGRVASLVFAEADRNAFFSIPIAIIRRRAGLGTPAPGSPGPFSATNLAELFEGAGLSEPDVRRVSAPLRMASAAECVRLEQESFGALHQMLAGLDEVERDAAWEEIETELRQFEGPDGFVGPCELLVGSAIA